MEIHVNLKKAKQLPFTQYWLKQGVRFLENDEQMTIIRDENGDDSVSVSTYSQSECQQNSRQNQLVGLFSEQLLKESKA